ncbi:hypothetical protein A2924_02690 [Candidatus Giovannonibacteria bacterium RIFCSPLOWO2_01_FULL_44_16]|uniref:Uncharacterized protein n=1 Tax=Candidatus Giovannonibacteria bacterium RIFCSPLOWO2_01_FULL_44_16 TaxID=1798348 RepID=A0A1F5X5P7_9BACT|nr:MAG: hypothetical protein A2924_02690 [Candidatus Giovannonibacteria bacterium RIFCSPLOWO2_01_FULL_44_16]
MQGFPGNPESKIIFRIIAHGPLINEIVGLAFWPIFPMLFVDFAVITHTPKALTIHGTSGEFKISLVDIDKL